MLLKSIFSQLFHGELSQTIIGKSSTPNQVAEINYPKLINCINMGIHAIYSRFILLEKEAVIQPIDNITLYHLKYAHAETNLESQEIKYIKDSSYFKFNSSKFLKVLAVYSEIGEEYLLNPLNNSDSSNTFIVYTPSQNTIQIPFPIIENTLSVVYQAAPNDIPENTTDLEYEVELPEVLLEALLAYVGDRFFSSMSVNKKEAIVYPNKFESICKKLELSGIIEHNEITNANNFEGNGWV